MENRKQSQPIVSVGISFLLVILIIMSMVVFALLSLSSALKDYSFTEKSMYNVTAYYTASNTAEETLAQLDSVLSEASSSYSNGTASYTDYVADSFKDNKAVSVDSEKGGIKVTITVPTTDTMALQVVATTAGTGGSTYKISSWKKISTKDWEGDNSIPVL
jgi:Tfp pilus assembly protein PilX